MFKPLEGVKVIDLTYFVAGPTAAKILADWGADVIKVEPSFGDPGRKTGITMSCPTEKECNPFYDAYNANKRGLSLNLKDPDGSKILDKILETADVFVTSYRTKALVKLGLDYDTLHKKHPQIVWAQLNGFGDFGPAKNNAGFDTVAFWARSGAMIDLTEKDTSPINPLIGFGDASTGCTLAAGICGALYNKLKTGKGSKVMISLFAQAIWNESAAIVSTQYEDKYPKTRLVPGSPVMNTYKSSDGKWFYISILDPDRYNNALLAGLGREDLIDNPDFATSEGSKRNTVEMTKMLLEEFSKHTLDEIKDILLKADIAHETLQHYSDIKCDEQALANRYVEPIKNRDGSITYQAMTPVRFCENEPTDVRDIEPTIDRPSPMIGEHSVEILKEYGYTEGEIEKYVNSGAVFADGVK